jgi:hypothetical protein
MVSKINPIIWELIEYLRVMPPYLLERRVKVLPHDTPLGRGKNTSHLISLGSRIPDGSKISLGHRNNTLSNINAHNIEPKENLPHMATTH